MASEVPGGQAGAWPVLTPGKVVDTLTWLAPLLGAAAALVHFWRIGYAPSLSLSDLGTVIGAFLLFSLYALALIVVVLLAPAAMIAMLVRCHVLPPPLKRAAGGASKGLRSFRPAPRQQPAQEVHLTAKPKHPPPPAARPLLLLIEIAVAGAAALGAMLWAIVSSDRCNALSRMPMWTLFWAGLLTILAVVFAADTDWARRHLRMLRRTRIRVPVFFLMYLGYWMSLLALTVGTLPDLLGTTGTAYAMLSAALILQLHWLSYVTLRAPATTRGRFLGFGCLMILAYAQLPMSIADNAVERFGLGNMRNVVLITTRQGCAIAQAAWPQLTCSPAKAKDAHAYRLENVDLLTRIGPQFLVTPPGGLADRSLPRFTLPADQVLSWSRPGDTGRVQKDCPTLKRKAPSGSG